KQPPTEAPLEGGSLPPNQQVQVKEQDKGEVKVKVTLKDRMVDFQKKIYPHISEKFTRDDANDFYSYWTEMNEGGYKMRFEKEKTWNISRRIVTWIKHKKVAPKNKDSRRSAAELVREDMGIEMNNTNFLNE